MFDYLTHERLTTPLFEQPKKKEKYYDFGSGNKTPKKESSTAERDARVRKAYSERQKKEERDEFLIGFNEFDNEKTFSQKNASKNNNSPSKKNINLDKIFKWDSFDDFQKGFNSSFLNDDEKEFYTQTKSQPQNTTKKYDDSFYRQNYQERATSRKKETDEDVLNIREAKRSINYSLLPQERARRIADAKESGDAEKYLSLSTGSDLDNFMDFESKVAYKNAKQEYLKRASENGYNPEDFFVQQESDMAGAVAAEEVTKRWQSKKQEVANNVYMYALDNKKVEMESVKEDPDYSSAIAEGARILPEKYKGSEYYINGNESYRIGENNLILSLINSPEYRNNLLNESERNNEDSIESYMAKKVSELTEDEKSIFRYYGGKGDYESVNKYWEILDRELNRRVQNRENEKSYMQAYENPLIGVAQYIKSGFQTPDAYFATLGNKIKNTFSEEYIPIDKNSLAYRGAHLSNQAQAGVTDKAYDAAGGEEGFGDTARFLANTGLSLGRSTSKLMFGPTGMLIASGLDTAGQTTFDALERGVDTERALALGTAAGAIEAITEKLPLDNLFKIAKNEKKKA